MINRVAALRNYFKQKITEVQISIYTSQQRLEYFLLTVDPARKVS